ncbi:carotenoid oxygenase family protein [Sphingorhabdus arenilitoris]|uniref:Dioxygenase n=1 Tax=Sphingorhabdus arenilitoris TaxID=1490041 RepID=A0ABV8REH3_9SPHN
MPSAVEAMIRKAVTPAILKIAEFNRTRAKVADAPHPFLTGPHTPMTEEKTLETLTVTGRIPAELNGRYLRIGPNPIAANPATHHWFTGDGMVHGVRIQDGKALWYKNRWLRSNAVSAQLGEPPAPGPRSPLFDTANTNVLAHAGKIYGLVEAGAYPVHLDDDLNTVAHDPFGGTLQNSFTAHPHLDPETGELHAICYKGDVQDTIWHIVVDKDGRVRREEPIRVQNGPLIHDCMITQNYVIILDLPVTFSMTRLLAGYGFPYVWNPKHKARVGLLPKDGRGADILWCHVDPCAVFHFANAYETDAGTVVIDLCAHDTMFASSKVGPDSNQCPFERWTIDIKTQHVSRAIIDAEAQEFPRPDERFIGKAYRYAFTTALVMEELFDHHADTRLFRHDLVEGTRQVQDFGPGRNPGEFVFVPRSNDAPEGDGWLMGFVINMTDDTTDYVILDAMDFEGAPVASVHIPHRVPPGFHGNWVAG